MCVLLISVAIGMYSINNSLTSHYWFNRANLLLYFRLNITKLCAYLTLINVKLAIQRD